MTYFQNPQTLTTKKFSKDVGNVDEIGFDNVYDYSESSLVSKSISLFITIYASTTLHLNLNFHRDSTNQRVSNSFGGLTLIWMKVIATVI